MTAEAPLMDGDAVVGIRAADQDGKIYDIKAKAVLLACGGFMANKEKIAEHFGDIEIVNMGFPYIITNIHAFAPSATSFSAATGIASRPSPPG